MDDAALQKGVVVRDATGRLSFFADSDPPAEEERARISSSIADALGPYARRGRTIAFRSDPGVAKILQDPQRLPMPIEGVVCNLIDRRIVGTGWLEVPTQEAAGPARIVFASLKGGVGRSTALAVAAADLARRNKNVLVVDLDLEAAGVGGLLLEDARVPRFGAVDLLVESGVGQISEEMLSNVVGVSGLTTGGGGRVDVMPAIGLSSTKSPENVMGKLARAVVEDISEGGEVTPLGGKISGMLQRVTARAAYDVVLIDSRAGLAELAAPTLLGLGATVLLFGTAPMETMLSSYGALFAALRLLANRDRIQGRDASWRLNIKAVLGKATLDDAVLARYRDNLYDLFADDLYDEDQGLDALSNISFDIDDTEAPHWPLIVPFNQVFTNFDPVRNPSQLTAAFYEQTYRPFLDGLDAAVQLSANAVTPGSP